MSYKLHNKDSIMSTMNSTLVSLPAPSNISLLWNFGSLLGLCLIIQILTGIVLASSYSPSVEFSLFTINQTMENYDSAWFIRYIHANGASLFFLCLYSHTARGIYNSSFLMFHTWMIGVTILLMTMAAAFLGYVLPANQMAYWGASVITNLFSEIPYIGSSVVKLIWGSHSVHNPTLMRFFTFHFLIPFIIAALVMIHITYLHETGSNNPLGFNSKFKKMFNFQFLMKDMMGMATMFMLFLILCMYMPLFLGDDDNFEIANFSVTPHHIQPEWYFLFAYAILRSIPNKLGGVIALALSIMMLYTLPLSSMSYKKNMNFYPLNKMLFWMFIVSVILLTWVGMRPVESPYIFTGQILATFYFSFFILNPWLMSFKDKTMFS